MSDEPDSTAGTGSTDVWADPAAHAALRRITSMTVSPDGARAVVAVQEPDDAQAKYVSSLWEIPLGNGAPTRLTWSDAGESAPAFTADESLVFSSARPTPGSTDADDGDQVLWTLPARGEATVLASRPGGLSGVVPAPGSGALLVAGSLLAHSTEDDDAQRRAERTKRKVSAILHSGMPIRHWDHELGDESPRLYLVDPSTGELRDLAPDAGRALTNAEYSISADGSVVVTTWRTPGRHGEFPYGLARIDTATGERTVLVAEDGVQHQSPRVSPDGRHVAALREVDGTFDSPWTWTLLIHDLTGGDPVTVEVGDLFPSTWVWAPDGSSLVVSGDLHGRGAVLLVDPATGALVRRLADDAVYTNLHVGPDGRTVYALRTAWDAPSRPVILDTGATDQVPVRLPTPAPIPPLPGRLVELDVPVGGATVHGWACLPPESGTPAPVMLWIHGGPLGSYNSWNWRWNPWVAVAHGWAVVLPDPALSTGYGPTCIERAWPYRADVVWSEAEAVLDAVLERPDTDGSKLALLGGSFGGFMANWIAGHSDRFGAIVTHAGLWAADQQHTTTDAAAFKTGLLGRPEQHPEWYAAYSPNRFRDRITTPMLVSHGNRDYRVPVSEALRLWFDLVEGWAGDPDELPHRFIQLTGEGHWVQNPSNAQIWWTTLLGFCGRHVLGHDWTPSPLL